MTVRHDLHLHQVLTELHAVQWQVSMNEMMETIKTFDSKKLPIKHIPGPGGVRGRNSDNALILEKLGWEPTIRLADGLEVTYFWIKSQLEEVRPCTICDLLLYHLHFMICSTNQQAIASEFAPHEVPLIFALWQHL